MVLFSLAALYEELLSIQAHCTCTLLLSDYSLLCRSTGSYPDLRLKQATFSGQHSCMRYSCM